MPTKTYTHRVVISRPDEIYRDDQDESCEPLGVYVLFESEAQARDYALQFIAERLTYGFTPSIVFEREHLLTRRYGPGDGDTVSLRVWYEPLQTALIVPSTTVEEVRQWFRSLHPELA
ncbi:MAG: hypothetical protein L6Q98_17675 [Anaerolineae bacterium]|nr:hypothetical protein [Anaerolineae bacterium]NUQ05963.1 hypothetical protein [Anaerolineae bacterium]